MGLQTPTAALVGSGNTKRDPSRESGTGSTSHDPNVPMICCERPMQNRFAHAIDSQGQTVFVAVWCCKVCKRVSL